MIVQLDAMVEIDAIVQIDINRDFAKKNNLLKTRNSNPEPSNSSVLAWDLHLSD